MTNPDRDLAVTSVYLKLNTVATAKVGGGLDFRLPFIGLKVKIATSVTRQRTHTMELTLAPEDTVIETRGSQVDAVLVEAIETVRAVMARAAEGDDPFTLSDSSMELSFGVSQDGSISLGVDGDLADEITHTLRVSIAKPAGRRSASRSADPGDPETAAVAVPGPPLATWSSTIPPAPDPPAPPPPESPRNVTPVEVYRSGSATPAVPAYAELPSVDRFPTASRPLPAQDHAHRPHVRQRPGALGPRSLPGPRRAA